MNMKDIHVGMEFWIDCTPNPNIKMVVTQVNHSRNNIYLDEVNSLGQLRGMPSPIAHTVFCSMLHQTAGTAGRIWLATPPLPTGAMTYRADVGAVLLCTNPNGAQETVVITRLDYQLQELELTYVVPGSTSTASPSRMGPRWVTPFTDFEQSFYWPETQPGAIRTPHQAIVEFPWHKQGSTIGAGTWGSPLAPGQNFSYSVGAAYARKRARPCCECGSAKVNSPVHSNWCPMFTKESPA